MNREELANFMEETVHQQGYGAIKWVKLAEAVINKMKGDDGKSNDNKKHEEVRGA